MNTSQAQSLKQGDTLVYNDGRDGHKDVKCVVLEVYPDRMLVQFEDRADVTTIRFSDKAWMDYLTPEKNQV